MEQRTIWKAFLITGISSILFLGATSCTKRIENLKTVNYIYKNRTDFDLVLEVYDVEGIKFKSYSIAIDEDFETNTTVEENPVTFWFKEPTLNTGDSIVIRFSNNQCLSYSRNSGVGVYGDKIFDVREYDNYSLELMKQNQFTLYYTISKEDYNQAIHCN